MTNKTIERVENKDTLTRMLERLEGERKELLTPQRLCFSCGGKEGAEHAQNCSYLNSRYYNSALDLAIQIIKEELSK